MDTKELKHISFAIAALIDLLTILIMITLLILGVACLALITHFFGKPDPLFWWFSGFTYLVIFIWLDHISHKVFTHGC